MTGKAAPSAALTDSFANTKLSVMSLLSVQEAAVRLSVSVRQVQHLVALGELHQVARGLVDEASVERLRLVRGASPRRAWAPATSWGAVAILLGQTPAWMGDTQRSRLRARLRDLTVDGLVERTRERAHAVRYRAHPTTASRLEKEIVSTAEQAAALGLASGGSVDGYVQRGSLDELVARHGLIRDTQGQVTLRATDFPMRTIGELAQRGVVLAALDLAESLDVRERRAGTEGVARALEDFRGRA